MLLNGGVLDGVRVLSAKSVDFMWRNHLTPDMLPMDMNGWLSDEHTGGSTGFTISVDKPILGISEDQWDVLSGDKRTGAIAWGGGAQTNWMVRTHTFSSHHITSDSHKIGERSQRRAHSTMLLYMLDVPLL